MGRLRPVPRAVVRRPRGIVTAVGPLRVIDGGQSRPPGERSAGRRDDEVSGEIDDDNEATVIAMPSAMIQEALAAEEAAAQMLPPSEVDRALDSLADPGAQRGAPAPGAPTPAVPAPGEPVWQPWNQLAAPPVPPPIAAPPTGPIQPWQPAGQPLGYPPDPRQTPWPGTMAPPGYAPPPGMPAYVHTPAPMMAPGYAPAAGQLPQAAPKRSRAVVFAVVGTVLVLGAGLVIGKFVLASDHAASSSAPPAAGSQVTSAPGPVVQAHPTTQAPTPTPPAGSAAIVAPHPTAPEIPAKPAPAPIAIASLEHPVLANVTSSMRGTVTKILGAADHELQKGDKLLEITHKQTGGPEVAALEKRIADLQALVKQDPATYEPFLTRARRDLDRAQPIVRSVVTAGDAGMFECRVKLGSNVSPGDVLGAMRDAHTWTATATTHDAVTATWSCAVADATHTAACKIQSTEAAADGTRVTVVIDASSAPWLAGLAQHPTLIFAR